MAGSRLARGEKDHRPRVDTSHAHARAVRLDGAFNVRDLGHLPVRGRRTTRCGLVYRADALDWLTPDDRHRLLDELSVGTVIDLRTRREAGGDGLSDARLFPSVRALSIPLIPDEEMELEPFPVGDPAAIGEHYFGYLDDDGVEARTVLEAIAGSVDAGVPVLFHCAAGRDRTGVVAALVLLILGVTRSAVIADYLESNRDARRLSMRLSANPMYAHHERVGVAVTKVDRRAIVRFLDLLDAHHGGALSWARSAGVSEDSIESLTKHLLVDR